MIAKMHRCREFLINHEDFISGVSFDNDFEQS